MCLITSKRSYKIAREDFTVWKLLDLDNKSSVQEFQYERGVLYGEPIELIGEDLYKGVEIFPADNIDQEHLREVYNWESSSKYNPALIYIRKGYHSYLTENRITNFTVRDTKIVEFIIPKGARYYIDDTGICVSNRIKMK